MSLKLENFVGGDVFADLEEQSATSNCLTNVPSGVTEIADDGLPPAVCTYYAKGTQGIGQGCLRVNCKFFHGTEEQLADLRLRCLLDESFAAGVESIGAAKRTKPATVGNAARADGTGHGQVTTQHSKRPIVCLNFLADACHHPSCRFLHLPPAIRPLPTATCEYFLRGHCTRDRCRFFHGTQEVLTRMHTAGITMYNPMNNAGYDPRVPVEELMRTHAEHHSSADRPSPSFHQNSAPAVHFHRGAPEHVMPPAPHHQLPCQVAVPQQYQPSLRYPPAYATAHSAPPHALCAAPSAPTAPMDRTVYLVVDNLSQTVLQMHTVTRHADGTVMIVSPSSAYPAAPPMQPLCPPASGHAQVPFY